MGESHELGPSHTTTRFFQFTILGFTMGSNILHHKEEELSVEWLGRDSNIHCSHEVSEPLRVSRYALKGQGTEGKADLMIK